MQVQVDKVNKWFGDRLEWIEKIHDQYYKNHLKAELTEKRDAALADLGARAQLAGAKVHDARENLRINQAAALDDLTAFAFSEEIAFADWDAQNRDDAAAAGQDIADEFEENAEAENDALNAWLDELVRKWAWWLKKFYGYGGYADHYYEGYHEDYIDDWHQEEHHEEDGHGHKAYGYG